MGKDETFQEFFEEWEKKHRDKKKKNRHEYMEKLVKVYEEKEGHELSVMSKWREVETAMKDDEAFNLVNRLDALVCWEDFLIVAEKKYRTKKRKEAYRKERQDRDAFKDFLEEQHRNGELDKDTEWKDYVRAIQKEPCFLAMIGSAGSTPHDLFDDYIEKLKHPVLQDRSTVLKLMKQKKLVLKPDSDYQWWSTQLGDFSEFQDIPEETRKGVFEPLLQKAKDKAEEVEKAAKKARKKFVELLQKTKDITEDTTYDDASSMLRKESAWQGIEDEIRRQCFDIFRDQLQKMAEESRKAEEEAKAKKEKKKAKKEKKEAKDDDYEEEKPKKKKEKKAKEEDYEDESPVKEKKSKRSREDEEDEEPVEKKKKKKKSKEYDDL